MVKQSSNFFLLFNKGKCGRAKGNRLTYFGTESMSIALRKSANMQQDLHVKDAWLAIHRMAKFFRIQK